VACGESGGIST